MTEQIPNVPKPEVEKAQVKSKYIEVAKELSEKREGFAFPGLNQDSYDEIKTAETEYPGFSTPVDELIIKLQEQGMKVVFGKHGEAGDIYILPLQSDDLANDNIFPRQLKIIEGMDEQLVKLIKLSTLMAKS